MNAPLQQSLDSALATIFESNSFKKTQVIQTLWSGYGEIARYQCHANGTSVVVKTVTGKLHTPAHPRGWNTNRSHQRKLSSYVNEHNFYKHYAAPDKLCYVPACLASYTDTQTQWLVLEDLDSSGFSVRHSQMSLKIVHLTLRWLAYFHAQHISASHEQLWPIGSYWHLQTRPDELNAMADGVLKGAASAIDERLNKAHYKTLIHGDAKLANFCFNEALCNVSAVDFQYVGKGCAMKDVVYFMGSCLDETALYTHAATLLEYYFSEFKQALHHYRITIDTDAIEKEWRSLYAFAWADFERFLLGWAGEHAKLNRYSAQQSSIALEHLNNKLQT